MVHALPRLRSFAVFLFVIAAGVLLGTIAHAAHFIEAPTPTALRANHRAAPVGEYAIVTGQGFYKKTKAGWVQVDAGGAGVSLKSTPPSGSDSGSIAVTGIVRAANIEAPIIQPAQVGVGAGTEQTVSGGSTSAAQMGGDLVLSAGSGGMGSGDVSITGTTVRVIGNAVSFDGGGTPLRYTGGMTPMLKTEQSSTGTGVGLVLSGGDTLDPYAGGNLTLSGGTGSTGTRGGVYVLTDAVFSRMVGWYGSTFGVTGASSSFTASGEASVVRVTGSTATLTSTPTISDPDEVMAHTLMHLLNTGSGTVTFQSQGTLPGSNLKLGASTRAVAPGGSLVLMWDGNDWREIHFVASTS